MPHTAEELEFWLDKRQKRMSGLKKKKRNQLIFKIATISLCILAVYFTWSLAMTVIHKMSLRVAGDVSSSDASGTVFIWTWNTVGKLYNTTFTGVGVWVFNTTPTNATDAPPVPPPAPPKDAPRDTKNAPKNSTDNTQRMAIIQRKIRRVARTKRRTRQTTPRRVARITQKTRQTTPRRAARTKRKTRQTTARRAARTRQIHPTRFLEWLVMLLFSR